MMLSSIKFTILATLTAQFASLSASLPSPEHQLQERFVPITLGAAAAYGALAGTTLTSTGNSLITGNCGTCPGTSITGFPPGICTGTTSAGGTVACVAEAACLSAYNNAKAATPTIPLLASDLGGLTLSPGVYTFPTQAGSLTGTLTLNGTLNPNGQFIFIVNTIFTAAAASKVLLINGAQACNAYFIVGTSASIGAGAQLQGNLIANAVIAVKAGASNKGLFCSIGGAVTLINNALTAITTCSS